jgi:excisionase family DNA binding protein
VNFDAHDLEIAWYCASAAISSRREKRQPIPEELRRHMARLNLAIRCVSATGQENDGAGSQLDPEDDWLTTPEVAAIMNCSARTAQRLAEHDLEGIRRGNRWLCRRSIVDAYAEERISE